MTSNASGNRPGVSAQTSRRDTLPPQVPGLSFPFGPLLSPLLLREFDPTGGYLAALGSLAMRELEQWLHPSSGTGGGAAGPGGSRYLLADDDLIRTLREHGFAGAVFELFAEVLALYGVAVCRPLIETGEMQQWCRNRRRPVGDLPPDVGPADHGQLADDTVVAALQLFRRVALVDDRWTPARGLSLTTHFIEACVQSYPTAFHRWYAQHLTALLPDPVLARLRRATVEDERRFEAVLAMVDDLDEASYVALVLEADGLPESAIAKVLGCSGSAVSDMLARARTRYPGTGIR
jgi:DNA-directed RNA polymerase specialized sigma24 family protein